MFQQEGWELTASACSSETSNHQQKVKTPRTGHRQQSGTSSLRQTPALTSAHEYNDNYEQGLEQKQKEYFSLPLQQESRRHKRLAEFQSTRKVKALSVISSLTHSIPHTIPTHRSVADLHDTDVDDKVMLYITSYKKSRNDYEKQREEAIRPQHSTHDQIEDEEHDTDPHQQDASLTHLKDKHAGKAKHYNDESNFDPTINEIEPEDESDSHSEKKPSVSFPPDKRNDSEAIHYSPSVEESDAHTITLLAQTAKLNDSQKKRESKDQEPLSTRDTETTFKVGVGPIFVIGPEPQNNTNDEDSQPDNAERNFRALIFPEDSILENSNENDLSGIKEQTSTPSNDSSHEGSTSEMKKNTPSKESTTTPSRPIIFPTAESNDPASEENVKDDTLLTENTEITESAAQPTRESTSGGANGNMPPALQSSESTPVGSAVPEDSAVRVEDMANDSDKNHYDSAESDDVEEEIEDPNANTPRPEEFTLSSIISNTTAANVLHQEPNSSSSSIRNTGPTVTTEKPKTQGTRLLIAQIFKSIFG